MIIHDSEGMLESYPALLKGNMTYLVHVLLRCAFWRVYMHYFFESDGAYFRWMKGPIIERAAPFLKEYCIIWVNIVAEKMLLPMKFTSSQKENHSPGILFRSFEARLYMVESWLIFCSRPSFTSIPYSFLQWIVRLPKWVYVFAFWKARMHTWNEAIFVFQINATSWNEQVHLLKKHLLRRNAHIFWRDTASCE